MQVSVTSREATPEVILCIPRLYRQSYKQNLLEFVLAFSIKAPNAKTIIQVLWLILLFWWTYEIKLIISSPEIFKMLWVRNILEPMDLDSWSQFKDA